MKKIFYEQGTPTSFKEAERSEEPCALYVKSFEEDDLVPLHYASSLEVLVCRDLAGEISVEEQTFVLGGLQAFVIAPDRLHSNRIWRCNGTEFVLKINMEALRPYMDIPGILERCGVRLSGISPVFPDARAMEEAVQAIMTCGADFASVIGKVWRLMELLICHYAKESGMPWKREAADPGIRQIIEWTEAHYTEPISLQDAADYTGYSKSYFCSRFKALTGSTYNRYLCAVRLDHAKRMLFSGMNVAQACFASGFEDVSYFIRAFKKAFHKTPGQVAQSRMAEKGENS